MMVWSLRAPIFSVRSFTCAAMSAISSIESVEKVKRDLFRGQERDLLFDEGVLRLGQDADELDLAQGIELDP